MLFPLERNRRAGGALGRQEFNLLVREISLLEQLANNATDRASGAYDGNRLEHSKKSPQG
jgi:hypothetical protein